MIKKIIITSSVSLVVLFSFIFLKNQSAQALTINPSIKITNLPEEVKVGDRGTFQHEFSDVFGISVSGPVTYYSMDPQILKVSLSGEWVALVPGEAQFYPLNESLDEESLAKLSEKFPNEDLIYDLLGPTVYTVNVMKDTISVYRLYNANTGEHFYTTSEQENTNLIQKGWQSEGIGWEAPETGEAVYRLYNPNNGDHHYTKSKVEKNNLVKVGWRDEGTAFYATSKGKAVHRLYNPNTQLPGSHFYTTAAAERDALVKKGWKSEGVAWYE